MPRKRGAAPHRGLARQTYGEERIVVQTKVTLEEADKIENLAAVNRRTKSSVVSRLLERVLKDMKGTEEI